MKDDSDDGDDDKKFAWDGYGCLSTVQNRHAQTTKIHVFKKTQKMQGKMGSRE
jgi:hypothetical protein